MDEDRFDQFLLKFTSSPKNPTEILDEDSSIDFEFFNSKFKSSPLFKDEFSRFSAVKNNEIQITKQ